MMRIMTRYATLLAVLVSCCGCGGIGSAYAKKLPGNFGLAATDMLVEMWLYRTDAKGYEMTVIKRTVFAVGWNDEFIIVKRHPSDGTSLSDIDRTVTEFYIVTVATEELAGPFDQAAFDAQRATLGLPVDLTFTLVFEDLE